MPSAGENKHPQISEITPRCFHKDLNNEIAGNQNRSRSTQQNAIVKHNADLCSKMRGISIQINWNAIRWLRQLECMVVANYRAVCLRHKKNDNTFTFQLYSINGHVCLARPTWLNAARYDWILLATIVIFSVKRSHRKTLSMRKWMSWKCLLLHNPSPNWIIAVALATAIAL